MQYSAAERRNEINDIAARGLIYFFWSKKIQNTRFSIMITLHIWFHRSAVEPYLDALRPFLS